VDRIQEFNIPEVNCTMCSYLYYNAFTCLSLHVPPPSIDQENKTKQAPYHLSALFAFSFADYIATT